MQYLSLTQALNIRDPNDLTDGDWHWGALDWTHLTLLESDGSLWGDYGISRNQVVPHAPGKPHMNVANHVRALLDMLSLGQFPQASGMRDDFIDNEDLNPEIFYQVSKMRSMKTWPQIDAFMQQEYLGEWRRYKDGTASINA